MIDDVTYRANINGMDALHKGIEFDFIYKILPNLSVEGLLSLGDWRWKSEDTVRFLDDNNNPILDDFNNEVIATFDAVDVHVGDAAQTQYGLSLRYETDNNIYVKIRGTYFDNYYSDFDPLSLNGVNARAESWKIPSYALYDLHFGKKINLNQKNKLKLRISVSVSYTHLTLPTKRIV